MKKLFKKRYILVALGIVIGAVIALRYIANSSGLELVDAQSIYNQSILSLDPTTTVFETRVTEGEHPWGIESSTTLVGGESNLAETYLTTENNTLRIVDDSTAVKVLAEDAKELIGIEFSYSDSAQLEKYVDLVSRTGLITNLNDLLLQKVEFTDFEHKYSSLLTETKTTLPTLMELAEVETKFEKQLPHSAVDVVFKSGIYTIDSETGQLSKAILEYSYNNSAYTVEVLVSNSFPEEITQLGEPINYKDLDDESVSRQVRIIDSLVGGSLAQEFTDISKSQELEYLVDIIAIFSRDNLYYPTKIELKNFLLELNPNDSTDLNTLTPLPLGCTNQEENYCSSYEIVSDLGYDGYGGRDLDSDLRDLVITP